VKKQVAIFRSEILPISETFIRSQASALKRWSPTLIGFEELNNGLDLPFLDKVVVARDAGAPGSFKYWAELPNQALVTHLRKANLVHAHFGLAATEIWPSVRAAGLPMLVTLHGNDINIFRKWWEQGKGGLRRRVYPRRLLKMSRHPDVHFLAVSEAIRQRAIDYGIHHEKVSLAHIGVDTRWFTPNDVPLAQRDNNILFVGRMVEKKGAEILIRAFRLIRARIPDANLVMIGDGQLLERAKATAARLGTPVAFLGSQTPEQVLAKLHTSKVFCLPSVIASNGDAEGLPISILEAQACGVPVVTSARGGFGEALIPGRTGEFFPEGDIEALAAHICRLLSDSAYANSLSMNARELVVAEFDIEKCTRRLESHYDHFYTGPRR
jgi:glycosyltransferase involved in cell wall biosynthesis